MPEKRKPQIAIPLDIPDVEVLATEINARGDYIISVESTIEGARCHQCGREITVFHGHGEWIELRHLPILDRAVYIRLRPKRYRCPYCSEGPTSTQQLSWYDPRSPHTKAYEDALLMQLINSTIQDVSLKAGLGYEAVMGVVQRRIQTTMDWEAVEKIEVLGLDEIALKKGHKDFVVIVTVRRPDGRTGVLAVLPNRKKKTVKRFLRTIPQRLKETIHTVCTDMYDGYINAVKETLGTAVVVVDRFHVAKKYRDGADSLRKKELKRLKKELSKSDYNPIKGALWPFRKNKADLEPQESELLERLFQYSPVLKQAYDFREDLTAIFDNAQLAKAEATEKIQAWEAKVRASGLKCFDSFLTSLDNWMDEITNYFLHRQTSAFVEGLNNKLKVIKRRCYGIFNVAHFFQRIVLDLEGYQLFTRVSA